MTLKYLYHYCKEVSAKKPSMENQIMRFYDLAEMEVYIVGASVEHECELAVCYINDLINGI